MSSTGRGGFDLPATLVYVSTGGTFTMNKPHKISGILMQANDEVNRARDVMHNIGKPIPSKARADIMDDFKSLSEIIDTKFQSPAASERYCLPTTEYKENKSIATKILLRTQGLQGKVKDASLVAMNEANIHEQEMEKDKRKIEKHRQAAQIRSIDKEKEMWDKEDALKALHPECST